MIGLTIRYSAVIGRVAILPVGSKIKSGSELLPGTFCELSRNRTSNAIVFNVDRNENFGENRKNFGDVSEF